MSWLSSFLIVAGFAMAVATFPAIMVIKSHRRQRIAIAAVCTFLGLSVVTLVAALFW